MFGGRLGAAACRDRVDLGVRAAVVVVPALAEDRPVPRDDGAEILTPSAALAR